MNRSFKAGLQGLGARTSWPLGDVAAGIVPSGRRDSDARQATSGDVANRRGRRGAAIGGFTGLFIGAIGGPFGLALWPVSAR